MAKRKNPYVGRSLEEFVEEQRATDPEFSLEWDKLEIARKIRALRENKRLTQAELAARAHTTQSAIARLESGRTAPTFDLLQKVAVAMGHRLNIGFSR